MKFPRCSIGQPRSYLSIIMTAIFLMIISGCSLLHNQANVQVEDSVPVSEDGKYLTESAKYWQEKVKEFKKANSEIPEGGILFLGDSITERAPFAEDFSDFNIINRGIGGDKIGGWKYYGVLDRLDETVIVLKPRKVFLMIGINDIVYANTPERNMKKNMKRLLKTLKKSLPDTEIYVHSILPARESFSKYNDEVREYNAFLEKLSRRYGIKYVDLYPIFADDQDVLDEKYAKDAVHLNQKGYEVWENVIRTYLYR